MHTVRARSPLTRGGSHPAGLSSIGSGSRIYHGLDELDGQHHPDPADVANDLKIT